MRRPSEPGPLGGREEHWFDSGKRAGQQDTPVHFAVSVLSRITLLLRHTEPVDHSLLMMSCLRRLAMNTLMQSESGAVHRCFVSFQHGVGCDIGYGQTDQMY